MRVPPEAGSRFIALYLKLLFYAGKKRGVIARNLSAASFLKKGFQTKIDCREAIYEPTPLIDEFLADRGDELSDEDREAVAAWNRYVRGRFTVLKHLKKHTILLGADSSPAAYAVLGLTDDLAEILPAWRLPILVQTVLVPYEGVIVCDGLLTTYNIIIGGNMRRDLNAEYQEIKRARYLITTL